MTDDEIKQSEKEINDDFCKSHGIDLPEDEPKASTIAEGMQKEAENFSKTIQDLSSQIPDLTKMQIQSGPPIPITPPPPPAEAPKWLVFEESIYNAAHIATISKRVHNQNGTIKEDEILLVLKDGSLHTEKVKNKEELWKKLQHVFTFGVGINEQQSSDIIQEDGDGSDTTVGDNPGE
jgi:hypothetical protein